MTIDQAINRLKLLVSKTEGYFDDEDINATKLGIEALDFVKSSRVQYGVIPHNLLPGETLKKE
ncbi:unnamed protein product [marine sediment metagenome]|uniref:Uncharacterized protein n=1 Tax=marine sediment metagenome TaxID=412755 RepID=X1VAR7_9ZZZZ